MRAFLLTLLGAFLFTLVIGLLLTLPVAIGHYYDQGRYSLTRCGERPPLHEGG